MKRKRSERVELRAGQLWAAHGSPPDCYGEFYFQAEQEVAFADALRRVSTEDCVARLRRAAGETPVPRSTRSAIAASLRRDATTPGTPPRSGRTLHPAIEG